MDCQMMTVWDDQVRQQGIRLALYELEVDRAMWQSLMTKVLMTWMLLVLAILIGTLCHWAQQVAMTRGRVTERWCELCM